MRAGADGESVANVAKRHGVSEQTIGACRERLLAEPAGLKREAHRRIAREK